METEKVYIPINGNAAYDLSAFSSPAPQRREESEREERRAAPRRRISPKTTPASKPGIQIPVFTMAGMVLCIVLLVFIINANRKINELNSLIIDAKGELSDLLEEEEEMEAEYDTIVDLEDVEETAVSELNMSSPSSDQTIYVELSQDDTAEIYESSTTFFISINNFFVGIFD